MEKILIISHLAMNKTNNVGKTMLMMFRHFDKTNLAQLYFNDADPDGEYCKSFFRITDTEMLSSIIGKKAGKIKEKTQDYSVETKYSGIHSKSVGRSTFRLLMRDVVWKLGHINRKQLYDWIRRFDPSVIFLAPGYNVFAYDIAKDISRQFQIPIVLFLMDDYYFETKKKNSLLEEIRRKWIRSAIKSTIDCSKYIFSVSREMADDYEKIFNKKIDVLYTPYEDTLSAKANIKHSMHNTQKKIKLFYAGSLGVGRWKILKKIGEVLKKYDNCILEIYASTREKDLINLLEQVECIHYGGFVSGKELKKKMLESDIVVHVESFDKEDLAKTRYSVSTKIPECLASQKMFFVVGPEQQSSIAYLKHNNAAYVCNSIKDIDIECTIDSMLSDFECGNRYGKNALELLNRNHDPHAIHRQIMLALDKCR